jgi:PAS domain S-box-containing protein
VAALDEQGRIIVWNKACEQVTGYRADEIIGKPDGLRMLYPDDAYREEVGARLGTDYHDRALRITCKDGSTKIVKWTNLSQQNPMPGWAEWQIGNEVPDTETPSKISPAR